MKNEELAYDAAQDVFMKLITKKTKLNQTYPSSLLYTMATNHCLNLLRKEKRSISDSELLNNIVHLDLQEDRTVTRLFLDQLFGEQKESTRTIAVLHYMDGLTLEETSEMVGLSVSGVRKRLVKLKEAGLRMEGTV